MNPALLVCCFFYYRHWIQRDVGVMLLLLLLHLYQGAAARVHLHEYLHGADARGPARACSGTVADDTFWDALASVATAVCVAHV